jgi:hypothetical protein
MAENPPSPKFDITSTRETIVVSSDVIEGTNFDFASRINEHLRDGFALLHIGQQTTDDGNGNPWHTTVAVLGKA